MHEAAQQFKGKGPFTCLALVKPRSSIESFWGLEKPGYCIFEWNPAFCEVQIRWGDGSWQNLKTKSEVDELILLEQFDEDFVCKIFD